MKKLVLAFLLVFPSVVLADQFDDLHAQLTSLQKEFNDVVVANQELDAANKAVVSAQERLKAATNWLNLPARTAKIIGWSDDIKQALTDQDWAKVLELQTNINTELAAIEKGRADVAAAQTSLDSANKTASDAQAKYQKENQEKVVAGKQFLSAVQYLVEWH